MDQDPDADVLLLVPFRDVAQGSPGLGYEPLTDKEVERMRTSIARNRPFGSQAWQNEQAKRLGLLLAGTAYLSLSG